VIFNLLSIRSGLVFFGCAWLIGITAASAESIVVRTGDGIPAGPISFKPAKALKAGDYTLTAGGRQIAAQASADGQLYWWTGGLEKGQTLTYQLAPAQVEPRVQVRKSSDEQIDVTIDGKPFTTLNFKKDEPKVYLYPVIGPTGVGVTRDFIMRENEVEKENKRQDHPHHRSLWTAHGDVRVGDFNKKGYDFWAEPKNRPVPKQVLTRVVQLESGSVFGRIVAEIEWRTPEGQRLFTEVRTYTFFPGDADQRVIDVQNVFKFDDMDVKFADTKEGGIVAIRLAVTMDEVGTKTPRDVRGRMTNSRGGVGAGECWGRPAEWCDYVGPLGDDTVGVAVLDHPKNLRHPTTWHIRDYGLYTANPFGLHDFPDGKDRDGSVVWKKGENAEFNYRIIIHKGDTAAARIADQWQVYKQQPNITLE